MYPAWNSPVRFQGVQSRSQKVDVLWVNSMGFPNSTRTHMFHALRIEYWSTFTSKMTQQIVAIYKYSKYSIHGSHMGYTKGHKSNTHHLWGSSPPADAQLQDINGSLVTISSMEFTGGKYHVYRTLRFNAHGHIDVWVKKGTKSSSRCETFPPPEMVVQYLFGPSRWWKWAGHSGVKTDLSCIGQIGSWFFLPKRTQTKGYAISPSSPSLGVPRSHDCAGNEDVQDEDEDSEF